MTPHSIPPQSTTGESAADHIPADSPPQDYLRLSQQAIEQAPVAMLIVHAETWQIKLANRLARELYERHSHLPAYSLYEGGLNEALPWLETRGLLAELRRVSESGAPAPDQVLEVEGESDEQTGSHWEYSVTPLDAAADRSPDLLIIYRDLSAQVQERKRAEAATFAAQQRTEMLESIFEQIAEAVIVRNSEGRLMVYNREALTLARNQSAVERARAHGGRITPEWELLDPEGKPLPRPELPEWRVMLTGTSLLSDHLTVRREDERLTPVLIHATPLRDEIGTISGAVVAFQDISIVKEEERLKDEFTSVASHELRQPITVIHGHAQRLKRLLRRLTRDDQALFDPEALHKLADSMESQTTRLDRLVSDLLDMSRIQAGHLRLNPTRMSLTELVTQLVEMEREIAVDHQFALENNAPAPFTELEGTWDQSRIEQILTNLLRNAVKYSPDGGEVRVTLDVLQRGARVGATGRGRKRLTTLSAHVAIKDEGIGIPPGGLQHIFERFYRAPNTSDIQGTGLGLYICQQLAVAHHGILWAESRGPGHGSTFHLVVPVLP